MKNLKNILLFAIPAILISCGFFYHAVADNPQYWCQFSGTAILRPCTGTPSVQTINASTTNLTLLGKVFDNTNSSGGAGQLLQSTGSTAQWVATSTLGFQPTGNYLTGITANAPLSGSGTVGSPLIFTNPGYITSSALTPYLTTTTAASTYYLQTNPSGYITSSALTPYLSTTTAASTYPTFTYATNTYQTILVSGTNIKTINSNSLLGSGDLTISGGSGNSAWTIGSGLIYNATSTDLVGIGTSTPSQKLTIQGSGSNDMFNVASSSGSSALYVTRAGNVGINTTTPNQLLTVYGNLSVATDTTPALSVNTALGTVGIGATAQTGYNLYTAGTGYFTASADTAKSALLTVNYQPTNPVTDYQGESISMYPTFSTNSSLQMYGFNQNVKPIVNTGVTESGSIYGLDSLNLRNYNGGSTDDSGTLANLTGQYLVYGQYNINASAQPTTTTVYGLRLQPYNYTGTIGTLYNLFIGALGGTATTTTQYAIYSANTANSYLAGRIGIGVAPSSLVQISNSESLTDPASTSAAITNSLTVNASTTALTQAVEGVNSFVYVSGSNQWSWTNAIGQTAFYASVQQSASASGTIADVSGLDIEDQNLSASTTVTNFYGVRLRTFTAGTSGSTTTNASGIAIASLANATNHTYALLGTNTIPAGNYGIYESPSDNNYFAGNIGIGNTSPSYLLDVYPTTATASNLFRAATSTGAGLYVLNNGNVGIGTTTPNATLDVYGSNSYRYNLLSTSVSSYTVATSTDNIVYVSTTTTASTITLPACNSTTDQLEYTVKDKGGAANTQNITVQSSSGNIDGAGTKIINTAYGSVKVQCVSGSGWFSLP